MKVHDQVSAILKQKDGQVWTVAPTATVYEALGIMASREIGALLVTNGEKLIGVLSERDYARKIILQGRSSKETKVSEVMASPAITIPPQCPVDDAMRVMTENRVRHLPVVDSRGAVLGVISIGDVIKWIITSQDQTIEHLESYIAGGV